MKEIIAKCKCGVFLEINSHWNYYQTAEMALEETFKMKKNLKKGIHPLVLKGMIEQNKIICLQFYPHTPIGFYILYHYDYDEIIKEAKEILKKEGL